MFWNIAKFEMKYQIRQPAFVVVSLIFFTLAFFMAAVEDINVFGLGVENLNSPNSVTTKTIILSILIGLFSCTAFVSKVTLRDFDFKMAEIIYSTRITKSQYIYGRFFGAFLVAFLAFSFTTWGTMAGNLMPWLSPERLGPFNIFHYTHSLVFIAMPTIFFISALFLAVSTLSRSIMITYSSVLAVFIIYMVGRQLLSSPDMRDMVALLDPFGLHTYNQATKYWTTFERNELLVPIEGLFLYNRLIWIGMGALILGFTKYRFHFDKIGPKGEKIDIKNEEGEFNQRGNYVFSKLKRVTPTFDMRTTLKQLWARISFEANQLRKSVSFYMILIMGIFLSVITIVNIQGSFGMDLLPVSRIVINFVSASFFLILVIILTYYTAEIVWREREVKINEVLDAMPLPNWSFAVSKLMAIFLILFSIISVAMVTAVIVQLAKGYDILELGLYIDRLFIHYALQFYLMAVLALFLQVISNNKYLAMFIMVIYILSFDELQGLGLEHNLYIFAGRPVAPLSDMNGNGHFYDPTLWFGLYWTFFSLLLLVASYLMWNRGGIVGWRGRLKQMKIAFGPKPALIGGLALLGIVSTGSYIFYNTNVLNEFVTQNETEEKTANYEKKYISHKFIPQPTIIDLKIEADIFPTERGLYIKGEQIVENQTEGEINEIHIILDGETKLISLQVEGGSEKDSDFYHNHFVYALNTPLKPNEKTKVIFETERTRVGFRNFEDRSRVYQNGTFITTNLVTPFIGFREAILRNNNTRKKYDLPPLERASTLR